MAFKKSLAALVFALPLVFGTNLYFSNNVDVLTTVVAASPAKRSNNPACNPLVPIVQDLVENLFDDECGDAVSVFFSLVLSTFI